MNDIKVFYLISGECIIAELLSELSDDYVISHPFAAYVGQSGAGIMPFCPVSEPDEFVLHKRFVVCNPTNPKKNILDAYRDVTGKIVLTENKLALN